jgi:hypothetical protein
VAVQANGRGGGRGTRGAHKFLCNVDAMGFEGAMSTVGGAEELRPGQMYFVLAPGGSREEAWRRQVARAKSAGRMPMRFAPDLVAISGIRRSAS